MPHSPCLILPRVHAGVAVLAWAFSSRFDAFGCALYIRARFEVVGGLCTVCGWFAYLQGLLHVCTALVQEACKVYPLWLGIA